MLSYLPSTYAHAQLTDSTSNSSSTSMELRDLPCISSRADLESVGLLLVVPHGRCACRRLPGAALEGRAKGLACCTRPCCCTAELRKAHCWARAGAHLPCDDCVTLAWLRRSMLARALLPELGGVFWPIGNGFTQYVRALHRPTVGPILHQAASHGVPGVAAPDRRFSLQRASLTPSIGAATLFRQALCKRAFAVGVAMPTQPDCQARCTCSGTGSAQRDAIGDQDNTALFGPHQERRHPLPVRGACSTTSRASNAAPGERTGCRQIGAGIQQFQVLAMPTHLLNNCTSC